MEKSFIGRIEYIERYPKKYIKVLENSKNFNNVTWGQKLYNYDNKITEIPKCPVCGRLVEFKKYSIGYKTYCSNECRYSDDILKEKIKQINIQKFGTPCTLQNKGIKEKIKKTTLIKFGVDHPSKSKIVRDKVEATNIERCGFKTNLLCDDTKRKVVETNLKIYGTKHHSQSEVVKEKTKQTNLKKCGFESNLIEPELVQKIKDKNLEDFGVEFISQTPEFRDKMESTKRENNRIKISKLLNINVDDVTYNRNEIIIRNYCKEHHEFSISPNMFNLRWTRYDRKVCMLCYPSIQSSSINEKEIGLFLKELGVECILGGKKIIKNREIDIYIPQDKLAIEYNGLYWHSNVYKDMNYHLEKRNLCSKVGINLIQIFEDEWIHRKHLVKSMIKSKLNIPDIKLNSSECVIKKITLDKLIHFLENNNLNDFSVNVRCFGLFYNDELVSVISFDSDNILTHCDKLNVNVDGSLRSFIDFYLNKHDYEILYYTVDDRFSIDYEYKSMGFKVISHIEPKKFLVDRNNVERYPIDGENFVLNEKDLSIYDCGYTKYCLKK